MELIIINKNPFDQNVYLYFDRETKEGVIIDPGDNTREALEEITKNDISIKAVLLTHGHYDHITCVNEVKDKTGAAVCCHAREKAMLENPDLNLSSRTARPVSVTPDKLFADGDILSIGGAEIKIIHTPGHSLGGTCYYDEKNAVLFTGDTLFKQAIGRTDLPGGSYDELINSIKNKLFTLPENVKVYPGHGEGSSVGYEKGNNPECMSG